MNELSASTDESEPKIQTQTSTDQHCIPRQVSTYAGAQDTYEHVTECMLYHALPDGCYIVERVGALQEFCGCLDLSSSPNNVDRKGNLVSGVVAGVTVKA